MTINTKKHARVANAHSNNYWNRNSIAIGVDAVNDATFSPIEGKETAPLTRFLSKRPKHDTLFIEVRGVTNARFNQYHRNDHDTRSKAKYNLLYKHVVSNLWASKKLDADNVDQNVLDVLKHDFDRESHYYTIKLNGSRWCAIKPFDGCSGDFYRLSQHYLRTTYRFSKIHLLSQRIDICIKEYAKSPAGMADMLLNQVGKEYVNAHELSERDALDCCNRLISFWKTQNLTSHAGSVSPTTNVLGFQKVINERGNK